ncbi:MAG: alpha/beta fold hydrolase [Actinomycetes bacterium]
MSGGQRCGACSTPPPSESGRISALTIVIWGERDEVIPRGEAEALVAAVPGAELVVYEDTGHLVLWERPERVASDVRRLLEHVRTAEIG